MGAMLSRRLISGARSMNEKMLTLSQHSHFESLTQQSQQMGKGSTKMIGE